MTITLRAVLIACALAPSAAAAQEQARVELNRLENADKLCRVTFVVENKANRPIESLKLDLAVFDPEGAVQQRVAVELGPVRPAKTVVRAFGIDGDCKQVGAVLVNDVASCTPGEPGACLDGLALTSRLKDVRLYK